MTDTPEPVTAIATPETQEAIVLNPQLRALGYKTAIKDIQIPRDSNAEHYTVVLHAGKDEREQQYNMALAAELMKDNFDRPIQGSTVTTVPAADGDGNEIRVFINKNSFAGIPRDLSEKTGVPIEELAYKINVKRDSEFTDRVYLGAVAGEPRLAQPWKYQGQDTNRGL